MHVESIFLVALSFNLSTLSTSSLALSHIFLALTNSDCASSISRLVRSLTLSAYAFSIAANLICSAACHFKVSIPLVSPRESHLELSNPQFGDGLIGLRLMDSCKSSEGPSDRASENGDRRAKREESDGRGGKFEEDARE